ncbi:uncharacterized protein LOC131149598 [Malania oleifera]|uniref:uncharacterized protein LOC131149598 n=1 Tax=Malania oleifera TaxID=397392 RepID=UPI0025AE8E7C|nr:uncharacterized protein LOC131149598 [Malania oleifera]XP_057956180.1 uncharacterized protein LOC131149598 [Malania oleifera]XP_057956181.1 uncharacterized protein LOC131149598 [Malania oleifera]
MGKDDNGRCVFPLTSLQIGDLQSYLSYLSLFLGPESNKLYILVDNRPWLKGLGLRSARLWQLMVTKSRLSPFANTKARRERADNDEIFKLESSSTSNTKKTRKFERWFSLIDAAASSRKRALLPVKKLRKTLLFKSELHRTLYGFIVFEVVWDNVRGINYLNELQTDTSLAIEAKLMRRWEFDSIAQAASSISLWFSGTHYERLLLNDYLDSTTGEVFYEAQEDFLGSDSYDADENICSDDVSGENESPNCLHSEFSVHPTTTENDISSPHTPPPPTGPYKRRRVTKSFSGGIEVDTYSEETHDSIIDSNKHLDDVHTSDCKNAVEATEYRDVLILFRFNDRDLPFKLKQIIMSDLRLLTLLESGLPSWVIFLQSYPGFCHLYRPWMCPLARALYVLISVITVLIGFYDLYKNVPVLKATASRLCGPLMDWIETWEMVSRIKYLGTMLFLHNFQKAIQWFLTITRTTRSFFSVLTQPMAEPLLELLGYLLPFWNMCIEVAESLCSVIWVAIESSFSLVGNLAVILLSPIRFILSVIWHIANSILYPIFWILWEALYVPIRMVLAFFNFMVFIFTCISEFLGEIWLSVSSLFQIASASGVAVSKSEVSMWRSLWNDLFSQVFRAVKSILNGFVAFFTACNRHRLSIYNHILEFIQKLSGKRSHHTDLRHSRRTRGAKTMSEARKLVVNKKN